MKFVSYAQNFEDVMLARALRGVEKGFYIDVGAQDPIGDSVTKAFYERGWCGINIDPVPHWHQRLCEGRPHDTCLRVLVGAEQGNAIFYEVIGTGLSTMSPEYAQRHRERGFDVIESSVPVKTLDAICTEQAVDIVHFLKIDVEGAEEAVLHGFSFTKIRPWIVLLESREPNTQISNHAIWESYLLERDYRFVYDDGLNRFYVACEHDELREAFAVPPNVFDGFVLASDPASGIELASATAEIDQLKHGLGVFEGRVATLQDAFESVKSDRDGLVRWAEELESRLTKEQKRGERAARLIGRLVEQRAAFVGRTEELSTANDALKADREGLKNWAQQLQDALAKEHARIESLTQQLGRVEAERDALRQRAHALAEGVAERDGSLQAMKTEAAAWAHEREGLRQELAGQIARCEAVRRDLSDREEMLAAARRRARDVDAHAAEMQRQLAAVHVSRSWRLTKPLRWVMLRCRAWTGAHEPHDTHQSPPAMSQTDLARGAAALERPEEIVLDKHVAALDQLGARIRSASTTWRRTDPAASIESDQPEDRR